MLLGLVALALPAATAAHGLLSYGMGMAGAKETVAGERFLIYVHPKDPTILLQPAMSMSFDDMPARWPAAVWRQAAEAFVGPIGCKVSDVQAKSKTGATWEATYACPRGVDLRALAKAQRGALRRGEPLHLQPVARPIP